MAHPGAPGSAAPPLGPDAGLMRRLEDLERTQRETLPAVMRAITPTILGLQEAQAELEAAQAELEAAQADLAAQQVTILGLIDTQIELVDVFATDGGIGFATTHVQQAVKTIAIPPGGYTKYTFVGAGTAACYNSTASAVYLYAQTHSDVVAGTDFFGPACQATIPAGFQATVSAPHSGTHTIPPGATHVRAWVNVSTSSIPVPAHALNYASVEGIALFSR